MECSNYNQQPIWNHKIWLCWPPWPLCPPLHRGNARQQDPATLQGDAASGLLSFVNGGRIKPGPHIPQTGFSDIVFGCPGACRAAGGHGRGAERGHHHPRGSAGHWRCTAVPKGDPEWAVVPLWGFSLPCHFSPKKGTGDGAATTQGHLWRRPGGTSGTGPPPQSTLSLQ